MTKLLAAKRRLDFQEACNTGVTPEELLLLVMRGYRRINDKNAKRRVLITPQMIDAAKALMPYRLPKLNAIDAHVKNVTMTHEEWVNVIEGSINEGDEK